MVPVQVRSPDPLRYDFGGHPLPKSLNPGTHQSPDIICARKELRVLSCSAAACCSANRSELFVKQHAASTGLISATFRSHPKSTFNYPGSAQCVGRAPYGAQTVRRHVLPIPTFSETGTRAPMFLKAEARGVRGEKVLEVAGGGRRWPGCA